MAGLVSRFCRASKTLKLQENKSKCLISTPVIGQCASFCIHINYHPCVTSSIHQHHSVLTTQCLSGNYIFILLSHMVWYISDIMMCPFLCL